MKKFKYISEAGSKEVSKLTQQSQFTYRKALQKTYTWEIIYNNKIFMYTDKQLEEEIIKAIVKALDAAYYLGKKNT